MARCEPVQAQTENPIPSVASDSIPTVAPLQPEEPGEAPDTLGLPSPVRRYSLWSAPLPEGYKYLPLDAFSESNFFFLLPSYGVITHWDGGALTGNISSTSMYGMMGVESGSVSVIQNVGKFTLAATGSGVKYGMFGGMTNSYGIGGSITYRPWDRLSFTLFGSYWTDPGIRNPGMTGFAQVTSFGGYADYAFHPRWGVKVGARAYRSLLDSRTEVMPTVMPYYRLGNGREIGIDVGAIVYEALKSRIANDRGGFRGNPTIQPPKIGPLPVGPALPPPVM